MKRAVHFGAMLFAFCCAAPDLFAEPIPEYVLQKDYENCLGGVSPQQDPQRAQYCSCVRNSMRSWDADTYAAILMQQAQTKQIPSQIEDIAKNCAEKVIH